MVFSRFYHRGIKKTGVENVGNWSLKSFDFFYKKYQKKSYARPMKYDFLEGLRFALNMLTISIDVF